MARLYLFQPHSTFNSTKRSKGCMELVDWTAGLEHWTGTLDWNTGITFDPHPLKKKTP